MAAAATTPRSQEKFTLALLPAYSAYSAVLNMEVVHFFEMVVTSSRRHGI
jgi:hypothetical protein